ncbi:MAG TPA: tryptophan-rich sensory protein [Coleofasciculaceae cyanobacterium]|jgi:tryptophan-rich sensory protein
MIKPWMIIGGIMLALALAIGSLVTPKGTQWFNRLTRPRWLTFEKAIPFIWTFVFTCGAASATLIWEEDPGSSQTWLLMGLYLLLELVTLAYSPIMLRMQSLKVGTLIGGAGAVLAVILAIWVAQISGWALILLIPYLIWSPIGTYTTWAMSRLNPLDA